MFFLEHQVFETFPNAVFFVGVNGDERITRSDSHVEFGKKFFDAFLIIWHFTPGKVEDFKRLLNLTDCKILRFINYFYNLQTACFFSYITVLVQNVLTNYYIGVI